MPRKSTGGVSASGASAPSTPVAKGARKSLNGVSVSSADADASLTIPPSTKLVLKQQETALKGIEAFELPRSNIIKCAKTDIPDSVQLRKEVQQALVKSATVFISYLTATAHDNARKKKGKIIAAQHVLDAVRELEFDEEAVATMKAELKAYRENAARKKTERAGERKDVEAEGGNEADVSRLDDEVDEVNEANDGAADESIAADREDDQLMDED